MHAVDMYVAQQLLLIDVGNIGHSSLGQELSFGDALRAQASPETHHHSSGGQGTLLSDLIEEHGPLAASAMSSPTHTTTFILPAQQTSPAQLAGLATDTSHDPVRLESLPWHLNAPAPQQLAWPATDSAVAAGTAAGDLMTFQVDGQLKLGLRPRQLTFSGSAQQPPQLAPQLWARSHTLPAPAMVTLAAPPQAAADTPLGAGHPELSPVPLLASRAASNASNAFTEAATVLQAALSEPVMAHHSEQTSAAAGNLQQQGSLMPANQPSQQASVAVSEAMGEAEQSQTGQQLTAVAPSLSWTAAPLAPSLSSQHSEAPPPPPAGQPSAVAKGPVRQTSAVAAAAAPSRHNSGALSRKNSQRQPVPQSRQATGAPHQSISRQGSAVQVALSRQASAAAEAVQRSARADELGTGPVGGPGGLEQAWAALLPSLLAEAAKQHTAGELAVLPPALQQPSGTDAKQQTVEDIFRLWAPIVRPAAAGIVCYEIGQVAQLAHLHACCSAAHSRPVWGRSTRQTGLQPA